MSVFDRKLQTGRVAVCFHCSHLIDVSQTGPVPHVHPRGCRSRFRRWRDWLRCRLRPSAPWEDWRGVGWPIGVVADDLEPLARMITGLRPAVTAGILRADLRGHDPSHRVRSVLSVRELGRGRMRGHPGWEQAADVADDILRAWMGA